MSSTLCIRKTPTTPKDNWCFKQPIKRFIGKRFYDHDGSLGGSLITIGSEHLAWFEGILMAATNLDEREHKEFEAVVKVLRSGSTIDMWFEG